jgi:hypothetical protein
MTLRHAACVLALFVAGCRRDAQKPAPASSASATAPNGIRFFVGGDSRDDRAHVVPWAFAKAKERGARAFLFLGDMELTPELDPQFQRELARLAPTPFFPVIGNHEVEQLGLEGLGLGAASEASYQRRFLGTNATPVKSALAKEVAYGVDLPGDVHFIALDNVSQKGFGAAQLAWLEKDLAQTKAAHVVVGMHKALAKNGVTTHSMDEDGEGAAKDSARALALFQEHHVELVFASHIHGYAELVQGGVKCFITGGLGAPLAKAQALGRFHHVLEVEVGESLAVRVAKFEGEPNIGDDDDDAPPP